MRLDEAVRARVPFSRPGWDGASSYLLSEDGHFLLQPDDENRRNIYRGDLLATDYFLVPEPQCACGCKCGTAKR